MRTWPLRKPATCISAVPPTRSPSILRATAPRSPETLQRMRALAKAEIELARRLYPLAKRHSVIAYEASNHYYYRPAGSGREDPELSVPSRSRLEDYYEWIKYASV